MNNKKKHLLVIRFSSLGDVAITIPVIRCLLKSYPFLQVTFVSRPEMEPLFREFKNIKFFSVDFKNRHKGISGLFRLFIELRKLSLSGVADLHSVIRTYLLGVFFKVSFFKVKKLKKGRFQKYLLTRKRNKKFQPLIPTIYRYADVFRRLGFPIDLQKHEFPFKKEIPKEIVSKDFYKEIDKKWIGVAPFAAFPGKIYPLDLMQEVISFLQKGHHIFLFGKGQQEKEKFHVWEKAYPNVHSTEALTSLEAQLNLISNLDLMISMDSANGHMAANFDVSVLTLWGMTHPFCGFTPFRQPIKNSLYLDRSKYPMLPTSIYGKKLPRDYQNAFRSLKPKEIIEKALEILFDKNN